MGHHLGLEDGAVNRAYSSVSLGVGVRVIKGDQTGCIHRRSRRSAVCEAASTAVVAEGEPKTGPEAFAVQAVADRYRTEVPWEGVGIAENAHLESAERERCSE